MKNDNVDPRKSSVTRRTILAGSLGLVVSGVAGCDDEHTTTSPTSAPHRARLEDLRTSSRALEPVTYNKTYEVGADQTYATITAAFKAVAADRQAMIGVQGMAEAQSVPWVWSRVQVHPGEYHETLDVPPHTAIIGLGAKPEDVRIHWDGSENTLQTTGRSVYVRNVQLEHTSMDDTAHPMRESGPSGDVGLGPLQRRTVTFDSVRFTSARTAPQEKCTNDMGPTGVVLTFVRCIFDGPGQPQAINLVTGGPGAAMQALFIGCQVISNFQQQLPARGGEYVPGAPFGAPDAGLNRKDKVAWIDGHWQVGHVHGLQGLIVFPLARTYSKDGALVPSTKYYFVNPGSSPGATLLNPKGAKASVSRSIPQDFDIPVGGISQIESSFYGKPPRQERQLVSGTNDSRTLSVKAGDVYWVAVKLGEYAASITSVRMSGLGSGTATAAVALDLEGHPNSDGNAQSSGTAAAGEQLDVARRWFFPGQGPVWLGISFQSDGVVEATTATSLGAWKGTGGSANAVPTTNLSRVPAGQLIPRLMAQSRVPDGFPG